MTSSILLYVRLISTGKLPSKLVFQQQQKYFSRFKSKYSEIFMKNMKATYRGQLTKKKIDKILGREDSVFESNYLPFLDILILFKLLSAFK